MFSLNLLNLFLLNFNLLHHIIINKLIISTIIFNFLLFKWLIFLDDFLSLLQVSHNLIELYNNRVIIIILNEIINWVIFINVLYWVKKKKQIVGLHFLRQINYIFKQLYHQIHIKLVIYNILCHVLNMAYDWHLFVLYNSPLWFFFLHYKKINFFFFIFYQFHPFLVLFNF